MGMHSFTPMTAGNGTCGPVRTFPALQQAACGSRICFCSLTICLSSYPRSSCPKLSTGGDLALFLEQSGAMLTKRPSEHRYLSAGGSCEFTSGKDLTNKKGRQGMAESLENGRIDSGECASLIQENIHYRVWEMAILQKQPVQTNYGYQYIYLFTENLSCLHVLTIFRKVYFTGWDGNRVLVLKSELTGHSPA